MAVAQRQSDEFEAEFLDLYSQVLNAFFDKTNISQTMNILLSNCKTSVHDCVSTVLRKMCVEPVRLSFTEHAFCPFVNEPLMLVPYHKMTRTQLEAIDAALQHCKQSHKFTACSHMGIGYSVYMTCKQTHCKHVDISFVLLGLYILITTSSKAHKPPLDIYNVMTQRLLKSVTVSPEAIMTAQQLCGEYHQKTQDPT